MITGFSIGLAITIGAGILIARLIEAVFSFIANAIATHGS